MTEEPTRRCAYCGADARTTLRAPFEWEWYLMAERGLDLPLEGVTIPLCRSCLSRPAALQDAFLSLERYSDSERESIYEDAHDFLDSIDLAILEATDRRRRPA